MKLNLEMQVESDCKIAPAESFKGAGYNENTLFHKFMHK